MQATDMANAGKYRQQRQQHRMQANAGNRHRMQANAGNRHRMQATDIECRQQT
jgi:hypothetical protein